MNLYKVYINQNSSLRHAEFTGEQSFKEMYHTLANDLRSNTGKTASRKIRNTPEKDKNKLIWANANWVAFHMMISSSTYGYLNIWII